MMTKSEAISLLSQDYYKNICLIEVLKHDADCKLIYAEADGVIVTTFDGIYLCDISRCQNKQAIVDSLTGVKVAMATDKETALLISERFKIDLVKECYQTVWDKPEVDVDECNFKVEKLLPTPQNVQTIVETYRGGWDSQTVINAMQKEGIYGVIIDGELIAYAGWHSELSLGMLEVLPKYRRMGIATAIGAKLISITVEKGRVPFGHIVSDNFRSVNLSKKNGFTFYNGFVYWVG